MGIRICPDCGGKVSDSRKDCIHCGYVFPVTKQCPDCGESVEENAKVCPECGFPFDENTAPDKSASNVASEVVVEPIIAPTVTNVASAPTASPIDPQPMNESLDETTPVVCPQCGSNDVALLSSELGKCRSCGTTVVLPKKEQQVNIVNNFVVSNNAENSANYYTIKRERTLNDEFIREAYVAMTQDRKTPIDISDGEFAIVKESNEQYIEVDSTANITYSATVGYDYKVTYTDYDSQGKPVQKTKTETEWKPFSGSHVTQSTVYLGNDETSVHVAAFDVALNCAEPGSVVPYDGTDTTEAAPLPPNPASIEKAKRNVISNAEIEAERSLPGDRHKDFHASGSATVNSVKSYSAPTQNALFKYKEEEHFCTAFAFGPFMLGGTAPDDSDSIHQVVKEKTNPLFIASLSLLGVLIALIVVAFTCPVGFVGALLSILVPACVMLAMLIASIAVTKSLYTKLINRQQQAKVERTNERLCELKLAPMTDAEKITATSKAGESSLTHKKNPLRIATIALCIIFFIGSIASVVVANNLNIEGYFDNSHSSGNNSHGGENNSHGSGNNSKLTFTLNYDGQGYAVTDASSSILSGDFTIPSTYNGKSVTTIDTSAFYNCDSLTSIDIPDSVTTIGSQAFAHCDSLTSIDIPDSVTTIGDYAFDGCTSLTYNVYDNGKYLGNESNPYLVLVDATSTSITSCEINEGCRIIMPYAFRDCDSLTSVTFGENSQLTTISGSAFYDCASLTSVVIPDSVTTIGSQAFAHCDSLTSVVIPDSVTTIGNYAFEDCSSLTSITIPDSVTTIGEGAFFGCTSLTSVVIPDSVTTISSDAFRNCDSLASVTIGDSVTTIGEGAFFGCSRLTSVVIPDSVTTIGGSAFRNCTSLTSVVIPDSVTTIGSLAFNSCDSLTSIVIPESVTTISNYAFEDCKKLTDVYYTGTEKQWKAISIYLYNSSLTNATIHYNYVADEN